MKQEIEIKAAIVVVLGLLMVTSAIFAMAPMWTVEAKKKADTSSSSSGTSDSDSGKDKVKDTDSGQGSGTGDTDKGSDKGTSTPPPPTSVTNPTTEPPTTGHNPGTSEIIPDHGHPGFPIPPPHTPLIGHIGGIDDHLRHGPFNHQIHKPVIVITKVIIEIKNRIHHSSSNGGSSHTHTASGTVWSNEDMATLNMIWTNGIKKGQDPVIDQFMARMLK